MTRQNHHRRASLAAAALFALSPAAWTQSDMVWADPYDPAGSLYAGHLGIRAHPDGGAIALLGRNDSWSTAPTEIVVRRFDENGDRMWSLVQPLTPSTSYARVVGHAVDASGRTAVLIQNDADCDVFAVGADGALLWTRTIVSVVGGAGFDGSGVGFTSAGDVYVIGVQDDFAIPPFAGRASVVQLDGATGQENWRIDRVAINRMMSDVAGGDAFLAYISLAGWIVERIDASGASVYQSATIQPSFNNPWSPGFLVADDTGRVGVGVWEGYVSLDPQISMLDPMGNVIWSRMIGSTWGSREAVLTTSGELVLAGYNVSRKLWRLDGSGALLWEHSAPANIPGYSGIAATPDDGVVVGSSGTSVGSQQRVGALEWVDPQGNRAAVETFSGVPGPAGVARFVDVDRRGNPWVGITRKNNQRPALSSYTAKVVLGGDPSAPYCAPTAPNSTGAFSQLRAAGTPSATGNNLTLVADQLPPGAALFALNSRATGFAANPGGSQGNLCLAGSIGRYVGPGQVRRAAGDGTASLQLELTETPTPTGFRSIVAGETWSFQVWHRDANPGATSNFTNGITVTFQ